MSIGGVWPPLAPALTPIKSSLISPASIANTFISHFTLCLAFDTQLATC